MCVCVCVCVCEPVKLGGQGISLLIQRLWVRFSVVHGHSGIVGVSLSKKLYSHCSSPPSCSINGYLVITGEANVKLLSMSTSGCGPGGTLSAHTITLSIVQPHLWALALPQVDLPALVHST